MRAIDADALEELFREVIGRISKRPDINFNMEHMIRASAMVIEMIKDAPTIQPALHWIPVTQDTPTDDGDYWATFDAESGRFIDWASWYRGRWVEWIEGSPAPLSNVIAWCKPIKMEHYKGVTT